MTQLAVAFFLATVNLRLIAGISEPYRKKYPDVDLWWLQYVSLLTGAVMALVCGLNVFADLPLNAMLGQILTAIGVGGGASLLYDLTDKNWEPQS